MEWIGQDDWWKWESQPPPPLTRTIAGHPQVHLMYRHTQQVFFTWLVLLKRILVSKWNVCSLLFTVESYNLGEGTVLMGCQDFTVLCKYIIRRIRCLYFDTFYNCVFCWRFNHIYFEEDRNALEIQEYWAPVIYDSTVNYTGYEHRLNVQINWVI